MKNTITIKAYVYLIIGFVILFFSQSTFAEINLDWVRSIGGAGNEDAREIYISETNDIYQTGFTFSSSPSTGDIFLAKWNPDGTFEWGRSWEVDGYDRGIGITGDSNGNIFIAGNSNTGAYQDNGLLTRMDSTGNVLWARIWSVDWDVLQSVDVIEQKIIASGSSGPSTSSTDISILEYDYDGNLIWSKIYDRSGHEGGRGQDVDKNGNIYITGEAGPALGSDHDALLIKIDKEGNLIWDVLWMGDGDDGSSQVIVSKDNSIYIAGTTTSGSGGSHDVFILKFDELGNLIWQRTWGSSGNEYAWSIGESARNSIYITGTTDGLGNGNNDLFLLKIDSDGNLIKELAWGTTSQEDASSVYMSSYAIYVSGVASNNIGQLIEIDGSYNTPDFPIEPAGGQISDTIAYTYDPTPVETDLDSLILDSGGGGSDALLLKFNDLPDSDTLYIPEVHSSILEGDEFEIPVMFKNQTPIIATQMTLTWEPPELDMNRVDFTGTACESWTNVPVIDNDNNTVVIAQFDTQGDIIESDWDTTLAKLIFESANYSACDTISVSFDTTRLTNEEFSRLVFVDTSENEVVPIVDFDTSTIETYICGDVNNDCAVNIFDITFMITYAYLGGSAPDPICLADVNADGVFDIFDIVYLIRYVYLDGLEPVCNCTSGVSPKISMCNHGNNFVTSGAINSTIENGKTIITINNTIYIMAMELALKSIDGSQITINNRLDGYQVYGQQTAGLFKGALIDVSGRNIIKPGEHVVLEIDGEVEIESAIAADINSQPVYFEINNSGKESDNDLLPTDFGLSQNHPNPFNPVTNISFSLPVASDVELVVYNVTGQRVKVLADGYYEAGTHVVEWDAGDIASGIYFYRIKAGEFVASKKMMLLK